MQGRLLFILAILIGSYSYSLFFLGLLGLLNNFYITGLSFILLILTLYSLFKNKESLNSIGIQAKKNHFYFFILILFCLVNLLGVIGPELSFDALWYHLTLPKMYLHQGSIEFIEGGLLYYSLMPKLVDLLYIPALLFTSETGAKFLHFLFGILTTIVTYKIANLYLSKKLSYLTALIFYSNLVVGWMSITAYIDLGRAFFASLGIYLFLIYFKLKEVKYLYFSAIIVGLEISTKLIGFSTLISLSAILVMLFNHYDLMARIRKSLMFALIAMLLASPWMIFSYLNSGSIFYPFFTGVYPAGLNISDLNPLLIFINSLSLFIFSADPISPIYLISLPLLVNLRKKITKDMWILIVIFLVNLLIWNFIPQKNARFMLPYLPIFSVISIWAISRSQKQLRNIAYVFIFLILFVNLAYRTAANTKYVPYILGRESKEDFLEKNLNFNFGDYIDIENKVSSVVGDEKVLVMGIHNLYYIDFNFVHESWKKNIEYKYILTKSPLTGKNGYNLIYEEPKTDTYLYERN